MVVFEAGRQCAGWMSADSSVHALFGMEKEYFLESIQKQGRSMASLGYFMLSSGRETAQFILYILHSEFMGYLFNLVLCLLFRTISSHS